MPIWFIAIGASGSNGLLDIQALLKALTPSLDAVVLIVLHRLFTYQSKLDEILSRNTGMRVVTAKDDERFERGTCYIGEPAVHLTLAMRGLSKLVPDAAASYRNQTIDLLFQSIALHGDGHIIGVILSGSLSDGSRGLAAIHHAGGHTMVITPDTAFVSGMPEHAIAYDGPIDCIGSTQHIADAIHQLVDTKQRVIAHGRENNELV